MSEVETVEVVEEVTAVVVMDDWRDEEEPEPPAHVVKCLDVIWDGGTIMEALREAEKTSTTAFYDWEKRWPIAFERARKRGREVKIARAWALLDKAEDHEMAKPSDFVNISKVIFQHEKSGGFGKQELEISVQIPAAGDPLMRLLGE